MKYIVVYLEKQIQYLNEYSKNGRLSQCLYPVRYCDLVRLSENSLDNIYNTLNILVKSIIKYNSLSTTFSLSPPMQAQITSKISGKVITKAYDIDIKQKQEQAKPLYKMYVIRACLLYE